MMAMTWDWVPVAVAGVGAAATVGVAFFGFRHAERLGRERNTHERQLASEARRQGRLADAYLELLEFVHAVGQWSELVRPFMDSDPPRQPPPLPSLERQARIEALSDAFASQTVRDRMKTWRAVITEIRIADTQLGLLKEHGPIAGVDSFAPWQKLLDVRPEERKAREALGDQAAAELGSRSTAAPTANEWPGGLRGRLLHIRAAVWRPTKPSSDVTPAP